MTDPAPSKTKRAMQQWLCAAVAAGTAEVATMPLDVTKIRLQLQNELGSQVITNRSQSLKRLQGTRRGMFQTAVGIYREEGFRALYKGLTPAVLRQVLCGGIGIGLYQPVKNLIVGTAPGPVPIYKKVAAASACGVIGQIFAMPTDVVKVRIQADARLQLLGQQPRYRNTLDAFRQIPKTEGFAALFRGLTPGLNRAAFMYGASTATYDHAKFMLITRTQLKSDSVIAHVSASGISGLVAASVGSPFDVIKTRIVAQKQSTGGSTASASLGGATQLNAKVLYSGPLDCLVKTVRHEGVGALYKGFLPAWMRLGPWQIVCFVMFEQLSIALTGTPFNAR